MSRISFLPYNSKICVIVSTMSSRNVIHSNKNQKQMVVDNEHHKIWQTLKYTHTHTFVYVYIYTFVYIYIHKVYIYIHTQMYTYTQM